MFVPQVSPKTNILAPKDESAGKWTERQRYFLIYGAIFVFALIALTSGYLIEELRLLPWLLKDSVAETEKMLLLNKLAAHLLDEIGIAGLIACGLAVTIERFSTREFAEQAKKLAEDEREAIKNDVFHALLGHFVPQEILAEMKSQILMKSFLRKNFFMIYTLRPFEDLATHSTYVLVDFEMKYDIINLSGYPRPFELKAGFSKSPISSLSDHSKFISVSAEGCENPFTLKGEEITTHPPTGSHISLNCKEPLRVKPGEHNPTKITIHSQTVKHFAGGSSNFSVEYHTCDLELIVHVDDRTLDVYSGTSPVSPDIKWLQETPRHKPELGYYNWKLQRPLLAFQSVYVTWDQKDLVNVDPAESKSGVTSAGEPRSN